VSTIYLVRNFTSSASSAHIFHNTHSNKTFSELPTYSNSSPHIICTWLPKRAMPSKERVEMPPVPSSQCAPYPDGRIQSDVVLADHDDDPSISGSRCSPDLIDIHGVREFFGGSRPIDVATVYRFIKRGKIPKPIKIGGSARWLRSECRIALTHMIAARDNAA
jgi:predicted DNA-binding transcriptional regulator AlpA